MEGWHGGLAWRVDVAGWHGGFHGGLAWRVGVESFMEGWRGEFHGELAWRVGVAGSKPNPPQTLSYM